MTRFVVTFRPTPGSNGIRSLRAVLKIAHRRFGLIAVDAREVVDDAASADRPNMHQQFLAFVRSIAADR
jgi:hypothetical protein